MSREKSVCLTGHRPKALPWGYNEDLESCRRFKVELHEILEESIMAGNTTFYIGMAEGFDMIAAEMLFDLRKNHKIEIVAVVPCPNQEAKWLPRQQERYHCILEQCDNCIILSQDYSPNVYDERNKFMVDNSSTIIACYNGTPSGTRNTLLYGKDQGLNIRILNPWDFYVSE